MPLYWTIDSKAQMVTTVAEGDVSLSEAIAYMEVLSGAKAMPYRKLFDGREGTSSMSANEMLAICVKIRSYQQEGPMGAMAVIATAEQTVAFARVLGALAVAQRPIKVFDNPRPAQLWIEAQASA
jgi:hypothetical protein